MLVLGQVQGGGGKPLPAAQAHPTSRLTVGHGSPQQHPYGAGLDNQSNCQGQGGSAGDARASQKTTVQLRLGCPVCQKEHPCQTSRDVSTASPPPHPPQNLTTAAPKAASQKSNPARRRDLARAIAASPARCLCQGRVAVATVLPLWGHRRHPQDSHCPCTVSSQLRFPPFGELRASSPSCSSISWLLRIQARSLTLFIGSCV